MEDKSDNNNDEVLGSQEYKDQLSYNKKLSHDAINFIQITKIYSSRDFEKYKNSILIYFLDDLLKSIVAIKMLVEEGIYNSAYRELRYNLEAMLKYLVVEQECESEDLLQKINYLSSNLPNSPIDLWERIQLDYFNEKNKLNFKSEATSIYKELCSFVHPSKNQLIKYFKDWQKGNTIGFEVPKDLSTFNNLLFRTYSVILVVLLTGFDKQFVGDLFINILDENKDWKYWRSEFLQIISSKYDYKAERKKV